MTDLKNTYFSENKWNNEGRVRVRQVFSITLLLCLAGIFLTLILTKVLGTGLGWSESVLVGAIDENASEADIWKVRLMAGMNQAMVFLLPSLAVIYILRHAAPYIAQQVSLRRFPPLHLLGWSIALLIACMPLVFYAYQINKLIPIPESLKMASDQANNAIKALMKMPNIWAFIANLTLIAVLPALGEELLFRGIVQNQLMRRMAPLSAILLSGAVFSMLHFQMDGFFPRWILGIVLGWAYWRTGNFWVPVVMHFLNNGVQVSAQFLYEQGIISFNLAENNIEVPWFAAILSCIAVFGIARIMSKDELENKID